MTLPAITIVTACYNSMGFIDRLADSLRAQTNRKFEWICVDDGSSDSTLDHLRRMDSPGELGMQLYKMPRNSGGLLAFHLANLKAAAPITLVVDHDDELLPLACARIAGEWHRIADDPRLSAMLFRIIDSASGEVIGPLIPSGEILSVAEMELRYPTLTDATIPMKTDYLRRFGTFELMEGNCLWGVPLEVMTAAHPMLVADPAPIRVYHRDNPHSQTNRIILSRKTVTTYARYLDHADRTALMALPRWLRHSVSFLRFSLDVHGNVSTGLNQLRRPWLRAALLPLVPLAYVDRARKPKPRILDFQPITVAEMNVLKNLRHPAA